MHVVAAAYGWLGERWASAYPGDLPEEWRLDYLANEYDAVVVPARDWRERDMETLAEWIDEVAEDIALYWELMPEDEPAPLLSLYRMREALPAGWILPEGRGETQQEQLSELAPVAMSVQPGEVEQGARLTLWRVAADADLRRLREEMDTLATSGGETLVLLVMPGPGAMENLQRLHTLAQLYSG